jgi:hypothetical protein
MKKMTITELENVRGGMPCWMAKIGLAAAGIAFVATVGFSGLLIAAAAIGLGISEYGFIEACFPEMMS